MTEEKAKLYWQGTPIVPGEENPREIVVPSSMLEWLEGLFYQQYKKQTGEMLREANRGCSCQTS